MNTDNPLSKLVRMDHSMPPRIGFLGGEGVGKTTVATGAPSPIVVQTEDGLGDIKVNAFPLCKTLNEFHHCLDLLLNNEHEYRSLIVDSADWLDELVIRKICDGAGAKGIGDIGHGKGYAQIEPHWRDILDKLDLLRKKGMIIIFTVHTQVASISNPLKGEYEKFTFKMSKKGSAILKEWLDIILFCDFEMHIAKEKSGFGEKGRAVTTGNRVMYSCGQGAFDAKTRFTLPEVMPLEWASLQKAFAANKAAKKPTKKTED